MEVEWATVGTIILATLALIGTITTAFVQRRTARETHKVSEAAGVINGYDQLCQRLRDELRARSEEIAELRARVLYLEQREREWSEERGALVCRIRKLEEERDGLQQQLDELKARYCAHNA